MENEFCYHNSDYFNIYSIDTFVMCLRIVVVTSSLPYLNSVEINLV